MSRSILAGVLGAAFGFITILLILSYYVAIGVIVFGLAWLILAELGILML